MSKDVTGGPAFPTENKTLYYHGMSLRDYFAAHVLQGICSRPVSELAEYCDGSGEDIKTYVSRAAYAIADSMIKERTR